jgi:hypothetical protein
MLQIFSKFLFLQYENFSFLNNFSKNWYLFLELFFAKPNYGLWQYFEINVGATFWLI